MQRSCQVEVRLGKGTPQSSDFLFMWDLKLKQKVHPEIARGTPCGIGLHVRK
jgi:hypothetical protein